MAGCIEHTAVVTCVDGYVSRCFGYTVDAKDTFMLIWYVNRHSCMSVDFDSSHCTTFLF
jgi:hypothetical protein